MREMETVLLTGHYGFIGSQLIRDLLRRGYDVIGVDNQVSGSSPSNPPYPDELAQYPGKYFYCPFSISNEYAMEDLFKQHEIQVVINCAAESHVDRSWNSPELFIQTNIQGPVNLANLSLKYGVDRFLQVSTDEVFDQKSQPFTETSLINPTNIYASTKASAEMLLMNLCEAKGLPLILTNGANTYGPRQNPEKIIPKTIYRVMKGEKVPLFRTPAQRMWLHVEDHSSGILKAVRRGHVGERYCLAPEPVDEWYTDELVARILELMDRDPKEHIEMVEDRPNYDLRYLMNNQFAKESLCWAPEHRLENKLSEVVRHYVDYFTRALF